MLQKLAPEPPITAEMLKLIASLDEFKGQWRAFKRLSRDQLSQLKKIATIESIGSSTRIEGSKLTDQQVATLLSGLKIQEFNNRDEEEVAGYAAAMDTVFESFEHIPVTENHMRQLHRTLLQYSSKGERHRGDYKTLDNHVAAFDAKGNQLGIVFETASPFETPFAMKRLVEWMIEAERDGDLHPLLITGVFVVWFLAIHPFQGGNGRLSRVLTTLLLLRHGYSYVPYASLESVIEENKEFYYKALRKTQSTLRKERAEWDAWLLFFLRCLVRQKDNLNGKIQIEQKRVEASSPLAASVMRLLDDAERVTLAEAVRATGANRNTLKSKMSELVDAGLLARHGLGRGVYYTKNQRDE
ncbi:Fic family protein [Prosthecobacter sp.]|uniref:Fic family protein n=1 Tax=Prosthecobacter sp. TaxID=1965333 RepID=UPI002488C063|nr:Fic family protein [Prosthecobacter sp.]MDI1310721.1 Fic family protein [Prosthecobacter sp.]